MALETGTYIDSLNASNPTATDALAQADDHMRLIKSTIKATFPNISNAVTSSHTELNLLDGLASTDILMPTASIIVFAGTSAPTGWLFCDGADLNTYTYRVLHALISNTYGGTAYNGGVTDQNGANTTFKVPDIRGRVIAGKEASASLLTTALGGLDGNTLGNTGGNQGITLTSGQSGVPAHTHPLAMDSHTHTFTGIPHSHTVMGITGSGLGSGLTAGGGTVATSPATAGGTNAPVTTTGTATANSTANASSAHGNVQPTIILNYCIKT